MPVEKQFDIEATLDHAMRAFWKRGYAATSMQDLVAITGVNRASLYATYGDKHDLFLAALRRYASTVHFRRLAELEAAYPPLEAISRVLLAFAPQTRDNNGCFLTNTALELAAHDPEAGEIVVQAQRQTQAFFEMVLRRAKREGQLAPHVKPTEAAAGLLAALVGVSVLSRSRPDPALVRRITASALRQLR